jgi:hypothetical protein
MWNPCVPALVFKVILILFFLIYNFFFFNFMCVRLNFLV